MSVTIQHTQERVVENGRYQINETVTSATGISPYIFVYKVADESFSRVATVADVHELPVSLENAVSLGYAYYRTQSASVAFDNLNDAFEFVSATKSRISQLARDYDRAALSFLGSETLTVTS